MKDKKFNYFIYLISFLLFLSFLFRLKIFNFLNSFVWALATFMIVSLGFYFSFKLGFPQFNFKEMIASFKKKKRNNSKEVSAFESLAMSLGGRVGVGSLAGVALAIYIGGAGSIFWMWVIVFIASVNTFLESVLGVVYQKKGLNKVNTGGPSFYIEKGLGNKSLALFYAIIILISYILGFLSIQSNTIVKSINTILPVNPVIIVLIIAIFTSLIIFKGVKKIATFSSYIVPLMGILYIILGSYVIFKNINLIPNILLLIMKKAFDFRSFWGGFLATLIIGIQRAIFANEAGLGTSAIASATTFDKPIKQGYIQVVGIYITTLVVCTITAFIILTTNYQSLSLTDVNGIEITSYAFAYHLGNFGNIFLCIIVILFAFSTIISGYYYGEAALRFIKKDILNKHLHIFKIICVLIMAIGGLINSSFIWSLVDVFVAILTITNMYSLFYLVKDVWFELKNK